MFEVVESYHCNAYRTIYVVRFEGAIYVLHAFQKKSTSGIKTAKADVGMVGRRLKEAQAHYDTNFKSLPKGKAGKHGK